MTEGQPGQTPQPQTPGPQPKSQVSPTPRPQAPPQPAAPSQEEVKKQAEETVKEERGGGRKIVGLFIVLVLVVGLLLGGGAVFASMTNYRQIPVPEGLRGPIDEVVVLLPIPKNPEFLLRVGMGRVVRAKSFKAELKAEAKSPEIEAILEGTMPVAISKMSSETSLDFFLKVSKPEALEIKGEIRAVGGKTYFKMIELPEIPFFDLSKIKDKWFYTETEKGEAVEKKEVDEEKSRKLEKVWAEFLTKIKFTKEGEKSCEGGSCVKVVASVGKQEVKWLLVEMQKVTADEEELTLEKQEGVEKGLENIEWPLKTTFLIGKKDLLIYEISFNLLAKVTGVSSSVPSGMSAQMGAMGALGGLRENVSLVVNFKFSEFGKEVKVEVPAGAVDIKTYSFEEMFSFDKQVAEQIKEGMESEGLIPGQIQDFPTDASMMEGLPIPEGLPPEVLEQIQQMQINQ